jgi:hypothetical protein
LTAFQKLKVWLGIERAPLLPGEKPFILGGRQLGVVKTDGTIALDHGVKFTPFCRCHQTLQPGPDCE